MATVSSLASARFDVLCLGEALVDLLPSRVGPLEEVPSFERHSGGSPANVAVGVARLGGRAAFAGTVGDDPFGRFLRAALAAEGVDVSALAATAAARTGVAFISIDAQGSPRFFSAGGTADLWFGPSEVAGAPIEDARVLMVGTHLLLTPAGAHAVSIAVRRARAAGVLVALDPNLRLHLWADTDPLARELEVMVSSADVVKLSGEECAFVTGTADPAEGARRLVTRGPHLAVVTTGPDGCRWARLADGRVEEGVVAARTAAVVDCTGAGDGFMAALLAGLARRMAAGEDPLALERSRLEKLLALAGEAGTRVCEKLGATPGLPRAGELDSLDV